jgi:hypothetical protein
MSMSRMQREMCEGVRLASVECALWISMGRPVLFLDQISAILEPSPNLPLPGRCRLEKGGKWGWCQVSRECCLSEQ